MKNVIMTIGLGMAFAPIAAFASSYVPSNVAWLNANNNNPSNPTTWPGAGKWQIDGASAPLDQAENPSQDYGVKNGVEFRTVSGTSSFPGRSLTIGALDYASTGFLIFRTSASEGDTTFGNEGLFLYSGAVEGWNGNAQTVRGKVTVRSLESDPVSIRFTTIGGTLTFRCPVEADEENMLYLHLLDKGRDNTVLNNFVCHFQDNALSCFNGSIVCSPVHFLYRNDASSYEKPGSFYSTGALNPPYHVTFQTHSGTMPGKLVLYPNAIFAAEKASTDFSVGTLSTVSLAGYGTNVLSVAIAADGSTCSVLRVTETLDLQSPIAVRLSPHVASDVFAATNAAAAMRLPILKAPSGVMLDPDMFFMDRHDALGCLPAYRLEVSNDAGDGLSTLWLVRKCIAWSLASDGYGISSFTVENWSDGGIASPGNDYLALHNLRTPNVSVGDAQVFPGDSLTLGGGTELSLCSRSVHVGDLRVPLTASIANLNNGNSSLNFMAGILSGTWMLDGRIRTTPDSVLSLNCYNSKGFRLDAEVSGDGAINIVNEIQYGSSYPRRAYVGLFGANTNFLGKVALKNRVGASTTLEGRLGSNLAIRDARSLGSPRSKWTYDALKFENCCGLHPLATLTLDDDTRGIYIQGAYAFFTVTNDVVFTCKERITYDGVLIKDGTGELALGGPQPYFTSDGNTMPTSGRNVLDVWNGTLRPVSAAAFQGLAVVITNANATLVMDVPESNADGDIGQYGMLNTVSDVPLSVPAGGLTVQLRDPNGLLAESMRSRRVPICTVNAAARAALDGKIFVQDSPSPNHRIKFVGWAENQDGSFTYSVVLGKGLMLMIF